MGVRRVETDYYDDEKDTYDNTVVYTTGCGCCSKVIPVYEENLDELCWNLNQTDEIVFEVFHKLREKSPGLSWLEVAERSERFEKTRKEKR